MVGRSSWRRLESKVKSLKSRPRASGQIPQPWKPDNAKLKQRIATLEENLQLRTALVQRLLTTSVSHGSPASDSAVKSEEDFKGEQ
jgi:hypothetical protein